MKQQLPLLDPIIEKSPESKKTETLREDINLINYPSESKNLNNLKQRLMRKPTKFSLDSKEVRIPNNYNSNPNLNNNFNNNYIINENNKSSATRLDLNGYKKVNLGEERIENLGLGGKIGSTSMMHALKEGISKEQMALKISLEDIKRKNEDLKKKMELKESKIFYKFRPRLQKFVDSNLFVVFFMILTFFIMFISDIQNAWLPSDTDNDIDILQTTIMGLFIIEILLTCLAKEGYFNSFFFWLDVVSTISIIQDIGFIFDPLLNAGTSSSGISDDMFTQSINNSTDLGGNKSLKSVNQALGKITAVSRITRILRIIRVIRLIRIVKLYKNAMLARERLLKKRKEKQRNSRKNSIFESTTVNAANPANNFVLGLKNMGRRFSLSASVPIKKQSVNINNSNDKMNDEIEKNKENLNHSNNDMAVSRRENDEGGIINNYVQITNIININGNNIDVNTLHPKIEMEIKTDFNRDTTAPSFPKRLRPSRSSIALTHKQLKFISDERKKAAAAAAAAAASLAEKSKKESLSSTLNPYRQEVSLENLIRESKTSKIVTEAITKKVIILILSILIMLPILDDSFYANDDIISYNILTKYISNYFTIYSNNSDPNYLPPALNQSLWSVILEEVDEIFPIVNITSYQNILYINKTWENYTFRKSELSTAVSPDSGVVILYSLLYDNQTIALLNILKTICLCILVTVATVYFESDVKNLVLDPLEIMIEIVDKVAKDPIKAKNSENLETGMKTTINKFKKGEESNNNNAKSKKRKAEEEYEVKIIQSAIMKISALLAIGIGEAGNEIIKENLSNYNDLDPMVKGRKKNAIFGFCDIRGFQQVNEALQENTMVFLNQIADVVHSSVDLFGGATNKNIGDAFLMVWRLPNELNDPQPDADIKDSNSPLGRKALDPAGNSSIKKIDTDNKRTLNEEVNLTTHKNFLNENKNATFNDYIKPKQNNESRVYPEVSRIADSSVFGFLKVIAKINRDLRILSYRQNPEIKKKIKDFKVNMGFGLHMGWAIEGAIGSAYKIDASYLSPNVNMAARLEAATRQYGVSILISGSLYDLLSESVKRLCRLIDIVTVKGSIKPVKFYTIDINENLKPSDKMIKSLSEKNARMNLMQKKRHLKKSIEDNGFFQAMMKKKYFKQMIRFARPVIFNQVFKEGFEAYIKGNWGVAGKKFEDCLDYFPKDGPTKTLFNFVREHNFQAPADWQGFRALTSK